ncbi:MAG: acetyl-CoA carboxylase biotin carboxyl carrier protein [Chloroflexota bacterium]|nr:acetyl-CoA carboxylase biotin carboxyl carrier protein [Chloroflexota bacterium]
MADPKKLRADANALVTELLQRLSAEDVQQLEIRRGGLRVKVSKNGAPAAPVAAQSAPAQHASGVTVTGPDQQAKGDLPTVNAPLTGVFYRSPTPQAPPFVQIGAVVNKGDVIALIEAMKLFNEIRSTAGGKVRRIFAENGQLVRAHQPLLELEPI